MVFFLIISVLAAVVLIGAGLKIFGGRTGVFSIKFSIKTNYPEIYALVNDKVSISAPIQINLPKGEIKDQNKITFDPFLKGQWVNSAESDALFFKPENKLEKGKYYSVALAAATGEIKKDFMADDDPTIVDIFPKKTAKPTNHLL